MNAPGLIQGRALSAAELQQVRQLLADHPHWSRRQLSRQVAHLWQWRNPAGQLKDMAARTLLLKLEQRGWIVLPPLACVLWGAAAWHCAARDRYVGWDGTARQAHLHWITNNTRFLIFGCRCRLWAVIS